MSDIYEELPVGAWRFWTALRLRAPQGKRG
jgi:hypothetical protein